MSQNSSRTSEPNEPELKSPSFKWVECIAVVKFDIDEGQMVEKIFPEGFLTQKEQKLTSLMAFPDSNSLHNTHSMIYVFKLPRGTLSVIFNTLFGQIRDLERKQQQVSFGLYFFPPAQRRNQSKGLLPKIHCDYDFTTQNFLLQETRGNNWL
jgi:hypothetical protein